MIELEPNPGYPDGEDGRYVPDIGLAIAHVRRLGRLGRSRLLSCDIRS